MATRNLSIGVLVLLASVTAHVGCSDGPSQPTAAGDGGWFNETMTLEAGDCERFLEEGLWIGFDSVVSDSRCPLDSYCMLPGLARVQLWLVTTDDDTAMATPIILGCNPGPKSFGYCSVSALGYRISLLELNPYPEHRGDTIDRRDYVATIQVEALDPPGYPPEVRITGSPPDSILLDPYSLDSLSIEGGILTMTVRYSGGCRYHDFVMYMSPAAFLGSWPYQANSYIRHDSHGDMCEALISEVIEFDLTPVASLYYQLDPHMHGPVYLNIYEYDGFDWASYRRIEYNFY